MIYGNFIKINGYSDFEDDSGSNHSGAPQSVDQADSVNGLAVEVQDLYIQFTNSFWSAWALCGGIGVFSGLGLILGGSPGSISP